MEDIHTRIKINPELYECRKKLQKKREKFVIGIDQSGETTSGNLVNEVLRTNGFEHYFFSLQRTDLNSKKCKERREI